MDCLVEQGPLVQPEGLETRKADYYRLVPHVPDDLVADEIRLALDRIAEVAAKAHPVAE